MYVWRAVTKAPEGASQWPQLQPGVWSAHVPGLAAAWPALLLSPPPASPSPQLRLVSAHHDVIRFMNTRASACTRSRLGSKASWTG